MKHTWKRWITAALALVLVAALFGCTGEESDKKTWTPGAFEQKDGNGDPSYSIRLPLSEDNTGYASAPPMTVLPSPWPI